MAIPLEKESKMWGLFYASDFNRLMFIFAADALGFMGLFIFFGLEGALIVFFALLGVATVYFVLKSFWPENHVRNLIRFKREQSYYRQGKEKSEVEP